MVKKVDNPGEYLMDCFSLLIPEGMNSWKIVMSYNNLSIIILLRLQMFNLTTNYKDLTQENTFFFKSVSGGIDSD